MGIAEFPFGGLCSSEADHSKTRGKENGSTTLRNSDRVEGTKEHPKMRFA